MIDTGFVISAFVPLVLYWICGPNHLRAVWRLSLGLGFIPAMLVFIWRLSMDEPDSYKKSSMKNVKIPYMLVLRRYWPSLVAISLTWFIYDFITYVVSDSSHPLVDSFIDTQCVGQWLLLQFGSSMLSFSSSVSILLQWWTSECQHILLKTPIPIFSFSITGGSDAIPVIFGWNIIIKYVLVEGFVVNSLIYVSSLFYIPGTLGGAFIVDYIGPKNCMVHTWLPVFLSSHLVYVDRWSHQSSRHRIYYEWPI